MVQRVNFKPLLPYSTISKEDFELYKILTLFLTLFFTIPF